MKGKTKRTVAAVGGSAVVIGSLVLLHKSGRAEHIGTVVKQGGNVIVKNVGKGGSYAYDKGMAGGMYAYNKGREAASAGKDIVTGVGSNVSKKVRSARVKRMSRVEPLSTSKPKR